ncbi:MAG: ABC transporter substrate-binding protein [Oscillospiraceae bacterium]|nr:ABC transporter substrate-binding protein [Oscillospiraceae bacterium]
MMKKKIGAAFLALCLLLSLAGCSGGESSSGSLPEEEDEPESLEYPVKVGDVTLDAMPEKVISLSPSLTEIVFDLGYEDQLAGVSAYCDWPEAAKDLPAMGTAGAPDVSAIQKAKPDLVLLSSGLPQEQWLALQQADIEVLVLARPTTLKELEALYQDLGRVFAGDLTGAARGEEFFTEQNGRLEDAAEKVEAYCRTEEGKKLSAVYLRMLDYVVATGDTLEGKLLEAAGFDNIAGAYGEWLFPFDMASLYTPNVIFCDDSITIPMLEQNNNYKGLTAVKQDIVYSYDFTAFERLGSRTFDILVDMAEKAYPDAFASDPEEEEGDAEGSSSEEDPPSAE